MNKRREKEQEIREIDDALQSLGNVSRLINIKPGSFKSEPEEKPTVRTLANRNVTKLVREYVAEFDPRHEEKPININDVRDDIRKQGVKGKDRSLYSAIHVILKKMADDKVLHYEKGVGFFKKGNGGSGSGGANSELVYSEGATRRDLRGE